MKKLIVLLGLLAFTSASADPSAQTTEGTNRSFYLTTVGALVAGAGIGAGVAIALTIDPTTGVIVGASLVAGGSVTVTRPDLGWESSKDGYSAYPATVETVEGTTNISYSNYSRGVYVHVLREDAINYVASNGENASEALVAVFDDIRENVRTQYGEEVSANLSEMNMAQKLATL